MADANSIVSGFVNEGGAPVAATGDVVIAPSEPATSEGTFNEMEGVFGEGASEGFDSLDPTVNGDEAAPLQLESAEVTDASPGSGSPLPPTPAPQLDPQTQVMAALMQQMARQEEANRAFQQSLIDRLAPKKEEPKPDVTERFSPKLREAISANPELKAFTEELLREAAAPTEAYKKELETRIREASEARQASHFGWEAQQSVDKFLSRGYALDEGAKGPVSDLLRDFHLTVGHVHNLTPSQAAPHVAKAINQLVDARVKFLNSQAKAKVQARHAPQPQQNAARAMVQAPQTPTLAEARAAGYRDLFEAGLDGDAKILAMRARQGQR